MGTDLLPYVSSPEEIEKISTFKQKLVEAITSGQQVVMYADLDKTLVPFNSNPDNVKIDPDCYSGLARLAQFSNVSVMALTGRDAKKAGDILTPGYEVMNSSGDIIVPKGTKILPFPAIVSHGPEYMDRDGTITQHNFGAEANAFIAAFKHEAAELHSQFPGIHVENGKHGSLGINVATIIDNTVQMNARAAVEKLMKKYAISPENPDSPTGGKLFQVKQEGNNEWELRSNFGKDRGIQKFGVKSDPKTITVFFCDSLGAEGTDKPAAHYMKLLPNGIVAQVLDERIAPRSELADVVFTTPTQLGKFLENMATTVEGSLSPAAQLSSSRSSGPQSRLTKQ